MYMKAFIHTLLAYDPKQQNLEGGVLGICEAYYGCVEAQGRGSLHCHMMVWVTGAINPHALKARILASSGDKEFQDRLIAYFDDMISTAVPPDAGVATRGPGPDVAAEDRDEAENEDFQKLVACCQVHSRMQTCFKYWKGHPDPKECRFDPDPSNERPITTIDPETGEITLRCLNGLVNNFNATILKANRCNMDIKFIGSGPVAMAVLYYITMSQLQTHVAYAAFEVAVTKIGDYDAEEDELTVRARRMLQKCAYSMISQQELSAPQAMSYLRDFEDHFTNHKYTNLYWSSFESFINSEDPSPECYTQHVESDIHELGSADEDASDTGSTFDNDEDQPDNPGVPEAEDVDEITQVFDSSGRMMPAASQIGDYRSRGRCLNSGGQSRFYLGDSDGDYGYDSQIIKRGRIVETQNRFSGDSRLCVWDFVAHTQKEKIRKSGQRNDEENEPDSNDEAEYIVEPDWDEHNIVHFDGRQRPRIKFLADHLQSSTHQLKVNSPMAAKDSRDSHYANRRQRKTDGIPLEITRANQHAGSQGFCEIDDVLQHAEASGLHGSRPGPEVAPPEDMDHRTHILVDDKDPEPESLWNETCEARKEAWKASARQSAGPIAPDTNEKPGQSTDAIGNGALFRQQVLPAPQIVLRNAEALLNRQDDGTVRLYSQLTQKDYAEATTCAGQKVIFGKLLWFTTFWGGLGQPLGRGPRPTSANPGLGLVGRDLLLVVGEGPTLWTGTALDRSGGFVPVCTQMQIKGRLIGDIEAAWTLIRLSMIQSRSAWAHKQHSHTLTWLWEGQPTAPGMLGAGTEIRGSANLAEVTSPNLAQPQPTSPNFPSTNPVEPPRPTSANLNRPRPSRPRGHQNVVVVGTNSGPVDGEYAPKWNLDIDWTSDPWISAPIVVTENGMKYALNVKMATDFAFRTGRKLHWYYTSSVTGVGFGTDSEHEPNTNRT
ncbi:hypothetical protein B0H19DRAFT_1066511 [Mycena capillaripes]|nr:hypothetical protein B0H19DRAFT_1066511 [Mycena capillaripes]